MWLGDPRESQPVTIQGKVPPEMPPGRPDLVSLHKTLQSGHFLSVRRQSLWTLAFGRHPNRGTAKQAVNHSARISETGHPGEYDSA